MNTLYFCTELVCFGGNDEGILGLGHTNNIGDDSGEMGDNLEAVDLGTEFTVASFHSGYKHVCALSTDNGL